MTRDDIVKKMKHLELTYSDEEFERRYKALPESRYETIANYVMEYIESIQKQAVVTSIPNEYTNINQEAFNEWIAYKKYKNKGAITKTLNMLNKYDFQTQQEMVDKSIMNEYKGLFEPKKQINRTDNNVNVAESWLDDNDFITPELMEVARNIR